MEVKPNGTVITGSYDDQDRLLQYGDYTFTYTANGELISKCQGSVCQYFDYDVFGNLRHVILDNGIQIEYVIDGRNRRIGKKINGTLVQGFIYDDQLRIVAELDGSNQVVSRFIYADHINVPEIIEKGGRTYRVLHDHLGSPRFVVDTASGEIAQELHYDAWGNITYDSNPGFQPFGFAGGIFDTHTKLLRFGARDYDPHTGKWMTKDPLLFSDLYLCGAANVFGYGCAEPVGNIDPSGASLVPMGGDCAALEPILQQAIGDACGLFGRQKCREMITRRGLMPCIEDICSPHTPCRAAIMCRPPRDPDACGSHTPMRGPCKSLIRLNPEKHKQRSPNGCWSRYAPFAETLFHEMLHECRQDHGQMSEILQACYGKPW